MAEVRKPSGLPCAKQHKPLDSDEDDEEPKNEPGTSSTSQPVIPVLPLHQEPAASANSGDEDSEYSDEYCARSQDSEKTALYPDQAGHCAMCAAVTVP